MNIPSQVVQLDLLQKKFKSLYILHFDAHADLRDQYDGEKYSHATAIRRCLDFKNVKVVSFGIRNLSKEEMIFYNKNRKKIKIFWGSNKNKWKISEIRKIFKNKNVYITFDVDGFDSKFNASYRDTRAWWNVLG